MFHTMQDGDVTIVEIHGLVHHPEGDALHEALMELLDQKRVKLVIDLTHCDRLYSGAIGAIAHATSRARHLHGDLRLCGVNRNIAHYLSVTKLDQVLCITGTRESALMTFRA